MAFSRTKYDESQYKQQIKRSADVGEYQLFSSAHESANQCYSYTGPIGSKNDVSMPRNGNNIDFGLKADAESELTNRVLPLSDSNDVGKNDKYKSLSDKLVHGSNCGKDLNSVDSRFTHPLDAYRGMNTTEYHFTPYLHVSPQCDYHTWRNGTNTRLIAKDTYQVKELPVLDNGSALPKPEVASVAATTGSNQSQCGVCGQK